MSEKVNVFELPLYKTILLKDTKGERYTYRNARAYMFDDEIHIWGNDYHAVFNKKEVTMFRLQNEVKK